jgi:hypothetical protein
MTLFPAALWAGAITPVTSRGSATDFLGVPQFSNISFIKDPTLTSSVNNTLGTFTYEPAFDLQGLILNSAPTASSRLGGDTIHSKLDNTGYSYVNRSYGVGAVAGLGDNTLAPTMLSYSYQEVGHQATITC